MRTRDRGPAKATRTANSESDPKPRIRVRRATDEDLADIAEAQKLWTDRWPSEAAWWVLDGDAELGYIGASLKDNTLTIARYYVSPDRRGAGAGRALIRRVMSWGRQNGATIADTYTHFENVASARNFIHCGFNLTKTSEAKGTVWLTWGRRL